MQQETKTEIKEVAIYIRKSRMEETEEDLKNHINMLTDICKKQKWNYTIYREVKSGAAIEIRPEMKKLLKDIELEFYNALLVVDQGRPGRGDSDDSDHRHGNKNYIMPWKKNRNLYN